MFDVSGRVVWRMPTTYLAAGQHRMPWLGQDAAGRPVQAGMYFVRARLGSGRELRQTLIRLR